MTEHKALKRLVRERMARHGESYTTARRHVLARAGRVAPPAGVLSGYDTFGVEWHRESALVARVLRQAGMDHSEPMVAGLAGGIGFMYMVFDYHDLPPLLTIVAQHHPEPWAPAALNRLGVPFTEQHSGKPALAKLYAALDDGRPALCTVDRSRLPWRGMAPGYGADPYVVAVVGRVGDTLLVDDESPRPNEISAEDFVAAWSAHKKGRHHLLAVSGEQSDVDLPDAIHAAVATTVGHLTGPVLGNNFDVNFGFSGMAKLAAQLRDRTTKQGWARRFGAPVPFYHGIRRLYECLELEYTAPGATRPTYAQFLTEAADVVSDKAFLAAAELFAHSGATWSELAGLALRTTDALGEYAEVAERRLALMMSQGTREEIRELTVRMDSLATEYDDPLGDTGRAELFDQLATLVEECLATEREAVALLT